ncbi:transposase [Streptomyces sp. DSM 116496]|uniref:IS701 family transposase n=1 Tax=Streptomyces stoeckheimensis TaxID=3344656 RepID=UPI0038B35CCA
MSALHTEARHIRAATPSEEAIEALCAELFSSFRRADHHVKGQQYLRGLLTASGRKSIQNIARSLGDESAAQRLHHFICNAPWSWKLVRRSLARHLTDRAQPEAWVVRRMLIPKTGTSSVGVHRRFVPESGRVESGQRAHGLWYAGRELNTPVDWSLSPGTVRSAPSSRAGRHPITEQLDEDAPLPALPAAPLVWDSPVRDVAGLLRLLPVDRMPAMVRLTPDAAFRPFTPSGRFSEAATLPAERILAARQAPWLSDAEPAPGMRTATARVALPPAGRAPDGSPVRPGAGAEGQGLTLFAQWPKRQPDAVEFWVTTTQWAVPADLHRLTVLAQSVDHDSVRTGAKVGLRDFEGRSYDGWHRHMTLASAAYAALMLGDV